MDVGRNNILQAKSGSHTGAAQDASAVAPSAAAEVCMELGQHAGSRDLVIDDGLRSYDP